MKTIALLLAVGALAVAGCSARPRVSDEATACKLAKEGVADLNRFAPGTRIASCDHVVADANPPGYYLLALHSDRQCEGICSTNLGWFAVEKSTGEVFDWDMAESKLAQPVS